MAASEHRQRRRLLSPLVLAALFLLACRMTGVSLPLLVRRGGHLTDIVSRLFPPDAAFFPTALPLLGATIQMSVTGTALGSLLALLAAPLCARSVPGPRFLKKLARGCIQVLRSFPALILALPATFLFGLTSFSGAAAITVYTFAILTRLTYEDLETAPDAAFRALLAMGSPVPSACFRALMPAVRPAFLTNVLYLLEANVRHSAILGYVGAGGIGLLLNEKVSWREYDKVGAILVLLFAAVFLMERLGDLLSAVVWGARPMRRSGRRILAAALAAAVILCTVTLQPPDLSHTSPALLRSMVSGLLHPDWSLFATLGGDGVWHLLLETVAIAFAGTCAGAAVSLAMVFFSTPRLVPRPLAAAVNLAVLAIRTVPFLIYGLIFIRVTGPGSFAGVLTLAMCSVGLLCKRFAQAIDAADFRPAEALKSMGTSWLPRLARGLLPQLRAPFASAVLYRFDVNIREASVLGLVGAGGIGAPLVFAMNQYAWDKASALALGLVLLAWLVDAVSARVRVHLS